MIDEDQHKRIVDIIDHSIVKDDEGSANMGEDMFRIAKELTVDDNVYRFASLDRNTVFDLACLKADTEAMGVDEFINKVIFNFAILRSAVKGEYANKYIDLGGSMINYQGMIDYRKAILDEGSDKNFVEKLKKM